MKQREQEGFPSMARESTQEKPRTLISSTDFCYLDASSTHLATQIHSFESNPELFNLTSGMEMLGLPSKNLQQRDMWKGFFGKPSSQGSSSSKTMTVPTSDFYQPGYNKPDFSTGFSESTNENLIVAPESGWQVDDSSLRCVFPCEGNERPSQGLSLSLSSNKPSSIGLQSFELRQQEDVRPISSNTGYGFFGKSPNLQQQVPQDGYYGKAANLRQTQFQLKNSKYLAPAQELLNEFCNLGTKQTDPPKQKPHKANQWEEEKSGASSRKQSLLYSLDLLELQKRKVKLLSMLEEVDRRYKQYREQMKGVVSSFEAVAGTGAAAVYSALALGAMSRHFRSLRDGIVDQIKVTKKAMGEKDPVAPGTTKGETPRLRLLDQTLRQQRAFQQMSMMESQPWRPQRGLPERSVSVLRAWLFEHFLHPYPSDVDKHILARQTGLSRSQVSNWFINARVRLWKPMVEEMYLEEAKEQEDNIPSSDGVKGLEDNSRASQNQKLTHNLQSHSEDQKPTPDQFVHGDSDSLSSIINNPDKDDTRNPRNHHKDHQNHHHHNQQQQQLQLQQHQQQFERVPETFGVVDLDFSSYNHHTANGVSLTLGLQQHGGGLSFSPASQHSLFYPRDHLEDYGEGQNLPYRNLMEAQLLHDLVG